MASLLMTMAVAIVIWCGISVWIASRFGRAAQTPHRSAGDEHALIIIGAARPRASDDRTHNDSANDDEYDASALRHIRRDWTAI